LRPRELRPQCRACLERLVHLTADLATTDATLKRQAARAAWEIVSQDFSQSGAIPALIASRFHRAIQEISGNPDPFAPRKALETSYLARMQRRLAPASGDDLKSALKLAALGNAVDFFRTEAEVIRELLTPGEFAVADLAELHLASQGPKGRLLYLADNAGEQFFDLPLVHQGQVEELL